MSDAVDLIKAILLEEVTDDAAARQVLESALEREVDVLLYCASSLGIGAALVMERAACWAGFAFYERIPTGLASRPEVTRLEALAEVRLFRLQVLDREVAFASPDFHGIIKLRQRLRAMPHLRNLLCLVPEPALRDCLTEMAAPDLIREARQNLARRWPYACAHIELTDAARYGFVLALVLLLLTLLVAPFLAQAWLLPLTMTLMMGPALIRLAAILCQPQKHHAVQRPADEELPVYSVLIPLRDEAGMVPQLFSAMGALDYPAERLDIKFVVEARSTATVDAVRAGLGDPRYSLVVVPDAAPRTKPKALDFALPLCRGEHVVVFDAEDVPDPDQLWKAALRFRDAPELICLQAQLVIVNGRNNWLAALFAGEYAGLFTVLLPALARWRMPMPLGGTSNHFRLKALRELGGWDAFNVTEDADLGIRLARRQLRVDVLDAVTREAAPTRLGPWLGQRTRWMKGWMQTFIVHNRDPGRLFKEMGLGPFLLFQVLVLGMIIAPMLHCGYLAVTLAKSMAGIHAPPGDIWPAVYLGMLGMGYGTALVKIGLGLSRIDQRSLLLSQLLLPLYWLLIGVATIRAGHELLVQPFYWFKSPHRPGGSRMPDAREAFGWQSQGFRRSPSPPPKSAGGASV